MTGTAPRVLALIYPGCTIAEIVGLTTRLVDAGSDVVHVGLTDTTVVDQSGLQLVADTTIAELGEIEPGAFAAVVVPGGDPGEIIDDDAVHDLLFRLVDGGATVGAICAGVLVLASAGVLAGRRATHNYRAPWAPSEIEAFVDRFWVDVDVEPDPAVGVVVDGPIVTALPGAVIDFTMTMCVTLGALDPERAELIARELRGEHVIGRHKAENDR